MNTGTTQPDGSFLPQYPGMEDIFKRIGIGQKGWGEQGSDAPHFNSEIKNARDDLLKAYASVAASPAGILVIEDLLDKSLRRAIAITGGSVKTIEQSALYIHERQGQNGFMAYILKMIHDGRKLKSPAPKSKNKK